MAARSSRKALLFGIVAAMLFGTHSVIARYLTSDMHGLQIAVFRLWIACAAIYLILRIGRQAAFRFTFDHSILLAITGFTLNYAVFHIGLEQTTATNAMVLENTAPFFVLVLLAVARVERIRSVDVIATGLALTGVYFTVRHDFDPGAAGGRGDLLELAAGLCWALFIIGSSQAVKKTETPLERLAVLFQILFCSAILLSLGLFLYPLTATATDFFWLFFLAIVPTALGYYLWYEAMAGVSTVTAALLFVLSVVFTFINASVFLGEAMTASMLIGGGLIILGVILPNLIRKPETSSAEDSLNEQE